MRDKIKKYLKDHPDYIDIVKRIIEYEKNNIEEDHAFIDDTDYDSCWDYKDVNTHPNKLYQLETNGLIDRVFDTNSTTAYSLINREVIEDVVEGLNNQYDDGMITKLHNFPDEDELEEMGIFDDVVGYEDIKFLMRRAMSSDDIVNILLVGPPGSAKTVFLMCINKLDDSVYVSGKPTSGPGFMDKMFDETPRYMAIDEIDQMDTDDQEILSEYTETGMLIETKGNNKKRSMRTNTKTFAAANNPSDILDNIENRFIDIHFDEYTREEFIEVCKHILPKNQGKSEEEAVQIAESVWELDGFGNVRKAIQAARLSKGDPEKILGVLDEYSSEKSGMLAGRSL